MHFARLVKQACVDLVSDLFVYYRLGCEPFVCSWGLHLYLIFSNIFTSVCQLFCSHGGVAWQGACVTGGACMAEGACMAGGACMAEGCAL